MNEQQLQQILTIQQAIAAAATAAVINSLLNPQQQQQAAGLATANALTEPSNDLQQQLQQLQQHQHHQQQQQQQQQESRRSPASSPNSNQIECSNRIQDLLMQLQQQAAVGQSPLALNTLNLSTQQSAAAAAAIAAAAAGGAGGNNNPFSSSPLSSRSPVGAGGPTRLTAQELSATTSNTQQQQQQQSNHHQASPIKKLKRHHHLQQQPFNNRSSEATSKPQHNSTPKNHSTIANLSRNSGNTSGNNNSSSSAFIANNVGLPRKLVRGQDVWLGRGAEQTRQILKCMWCGQSFRTLAEMTQHMKITQHYTNIMSQEQITSWRQPENSDATTNSKHGKQAAAQVRNLEDNHDDLSDKFKDSDREDSFSNEDESDHHSKHLQQCLGQQQHSSRLLEQHSKRDSSLHIASEPNNDDSFKAVKGSPNPKPLTRSRKRENETQPIKREVSGEGSPASSSSSQQQRQSSASNLILGESNEGSETNKECKTNGSPIESSADTKPTTPTLSASKTPVSEDDENQNVAEQDYEDDDTGVKREAESNGPDYDDYDGGAGVASGGNDCDAGDEGGYDETDDDASKKRRRKDGDSTGSDANDDQRSEIARDDLIEGNDEVGDNDDDQRSETNESSTTTTSGANQSAAVAAGGQRGGETGDPLSALETMVEKSFDPRLRPSVATGGILQRLGIDEEVCPPWHAHINYANWYAAAAAYGHPMAAALLANLQNGIKLSKNVSKKNED